MHEHAATGDDRGVILGRDHDSRGGFNREAHQGHKASEKQTHETSSVNARCPPGQTEDGMRVKRSRLRATVAFRQFLSTRRFAVFRGDFLA
jgi:hypothetical protein